MVSTKRINITSIITYVISIFMCCLLAVIFNYVFLEGILIPDPCYYHNNDNVSKLFYLFYDCPSWNGGHPWPTRLNFFITIICGVFIGIVVSRLIIKINTYFDNKKMRRKMGCC